MYYVLLLGIFLIIISVFNITPLLDIFDRFYTFRWLFGTTIFRILIMNKITFLKNPFCYPCIRLR